MEQKFKRGNLVRVLVGQQVHTNKGIEDISPEDVGREAIIEYSYAEEYGGDDINSYSIIFLDDGSSLAWKSTNELEFIDKGGSRLFKQAKGNRKKISKQNTDIKYILEHLEEDGLSSESILYLFNLIGFKSSFLKNGEFFILFSDWHKTYNWFVHIKNSKTIEEAKSIFTDKGLSTLTIDKVFNAFHLK